MARYKSKLIEKIGFKHHKARYDSHHKKVSLFRKRLLNRLNLERTKEIDYLNGLLRKVLKASAKLDFNKNDFLNKKITQ